jgi:hypothetical protein
VALLVGLLDFGLLEGAQLERITPPEQRLERLLLIPVEVQRHLLILLSPQPQPIVRQSLQQQPLIHLNPQPLLSIHLNQQLQPLIQPDQQAKQHQGQHRFMRDLAVDSSVSKSISGNAQDMIRFGIGQFKKDKDAIVYNEKYFILFEVEEYVKKVAQNYKIELSYDVTAKEDLYFKTINYTTYAGFFILHPLCFEQSMRQMMDAYADNCKIKKGGHIGYIKKSILNNKNFSKYSFSFMDDQKPKDALVVLTGANKLKKHSCVGKIQSIIDKHGKENVLFKKHPISDNKAYEELSEHLGGINYASGKSNLHDLMGSASHL